MRRRMTLLLTHPTRLLQWRQQVWPLFLLGPRSRFQLLQPNVSVGNRWRGLLRKKKSSFRWWTMMVLGMSWRPSQRKSTSLKRMQSPFPSNLLLLHTLWFVVNGLLGVADITHSNLIASCTQNVSIVSLIEQISLGWLLLPNVEGLSSSGEARIVRNLVLLTILKFYFSVQLPHFPSFKSPFSRPLIIETRQDIHFRRILVHGVCYLRLNYCSGPSWSTSSPKSSISASIRDKLKSPNSTSRALSATCVVTVSNEADSPLAVRR